MTVEQLMEHDDRPQDDRIVVLHGATWADYQRLMEIRGDQASPRISFLEGALEIMRPSKTHETIKSKIGRLVEVWCLENSIAFEPVGSWTLENKASERGVEPDECYVFQDLESAERPDLAIEVVWTSGGINKLEIYRKLKVREVWFWRRNRLTVHLLENESYREVSQSQVLPGIDLDLLVSFLGMPTYQAIQQYRAKLQAQRLQ